MSVNFNSSYQSTNTIVGGMTFLTVYTSLDIRPTGVIATAAEANPSGVYPFVNAQGTTYASVIAYNDARARQLNFDSIVRVAQQRGQPAILGPVETLTAGTEFTSATLGLNLVNDVAVTSVYKVRMAFEHPELWGVDTLRNDNATPAAGTVLDNLEFGLLIDGVGSFIYDRTAVGTINVFAQVAASLS